ncbi:MAG: hypothetical protein IPK11_15535 [Ignavibacteria bacterium]|nr:hypothetical protein [Ignavibacteria bacterium]
MMAIFTVHHRSEESIEQNRCIILEALSLVSLAGDAQEQPLTTIVRWEAALDAKSV